jgi:hypothetical protein
MSVYQYSLANESKYEKEQNTLTRKEPNRKEPNRKEPNRKEPNRKEPNRKEPNRKEPKEPKEPNKLNREDTTKLKEDGSLRCQGMEEQHNFGKKRKTEKKRKTCKRKTMTARKSKRMLEKRSRKIKQLSIF